MKRRVVFLFLLFAMISQTFAVKLGIDRGAVRLVLDESNGAVILYTRNNKIEDENDQLTSILSAENRDELSRYLLKVGPNIYDLAPRRQELTVMAEETLFGISITYTVADVASVLLDFLFFSHVPGILQDTVRIAITVKNLSSMTDTFALKGVFDTYLGEKKFHHFSTLVDEKIINETFFENIEEIKWIDSSDPQISMKFVLEGWDITPPNWAAITTRSNAFNRVWKTPIVANVPLTSFAANNNSAVTIAWDEVKLEPEGQVEYAFYITTGIEGTEAPSNLEQAYLGKLDLYQPEKEGPNTDFLDPAYTLSDVAVPCKKNDELC